MYPPPELYPYIYPYIYPNPNPNPNPHQVALLLEGRPREASVRAVTFCNMYSFSKDSLDYLLRLYPEVRP